eukprot:Seg4593.5 transcript_id=Seg4593.5/GoldUCD/mRNA.D3Y31 product="hypothetical protein" protein_id=Seg4593.5/GoldUCD/D3Y31
MFYVPDPKHVAQLLVSGDVQTNPGPVKNPCSVCGKSTSINHRKLICSGCNLQCHIGPKCGNISQHQYMQFQSQVSYIWHCPKCLHQGDLNTSQTQDHHVENLEEIDDSLIDIAPDVFEELRNSLVSKGRGIRIAHLNVRGLLRKFNEIILLIKESNMDILVITESHLDSTVSDEQIAIDGYGLKRCDRNRHGGGVLVYFNNSLDITPFQNIDRLGTESIWMDLTLHSQHYLIAGTYRPPDKPEFYENLSSILEDIWVKRKNILLLGDFNSDVLFKGKSKDQTRQGRRLLQVTNRYTLKKCYNLTDKDL